MSNWELATGKPVHFEPEGEWLVVGLPAPPHNFTLMESFAEETLERAVDKGTCKVVLELNLQDVLSSVFIGQMLKLDDNLRKCGGELRICGLRNGYQDFESMRLAERFPNHPDRATAIAGCPIT